MLSGATVESAIAKAEAVINQLAQEAETHTAQEALREKVAQLILELDRQEIKVAVTGGKSVGKSTLIQLLSRGWQEIQQKVSFYETAAFV